MSEYPAYRYHPDGHLALVYSRGEDAQLIGWLNSPPEGFKLPKQAHFFGLEKMPIELQRPVIKVPLSEAPEASEITVVPRRTSTMSAFERAQLKAKVRKQQVERSRQKAAAK